MRKIYIASSWKNSKQVSELAKELRERGHQVFDFSDADNRPEGLGNFVFNAREFTEYSGKNPEDVDWFNFLTWEPTKEAFESDKAGIDWADTLILLNPAGRSTHLEAGYAVGTGKEVFIFGDLPVGNFDAMYLFADGWYRSSEKDGMFSHLEEETNKEPQISNIIHRIVNIEKRLIMLGKTDAHTGEQTLENRLDIIEGSISLIQQAHSSHTNFKEVEFWDKHDPVIDALKDDEK